MTFFVYVDDECVWSFDEALLARLLAHNIWLAVDDEKVVVKMFDEALDDYVVVYTPYYNTTPYDPTPYDE